MKNLFASTNWIPYAVAAALVLITLAAVFWSGTPAQGPVARQLPPVQDVNIEPGFVGKQAFGVWLLVCENVDAAAASAAKRVCRTNSRVLVRGPNNAQLLAAGLNIVMADNQKAPGLVFLLPPAARAAASISFAIDKNTMFQVPLRCDEKQCLAQGALPDDAVEQLRSGKTLSILYTVKDKAQKDRKVRVDQLLHGFRQSYDAMTRAMGA